MPKKSLGMTVLEAAHQRIAWTFDTFDRICVSFSGGKDSTVMLHLVMTEAIKRNRKVGVLFIDLEAQYDATIQHIQTCFDLYEAHIEPYWVSLPLHLRNAVSVYEPFWKCWDSESESAWVRHPPDMAITDPATLPFFEDGMEFEEFVPLFGEWFAQGKPTACLVGIRTDESLNRYRTLASLTKEFLDGYRWTTRTTENAYNVYPIYDWRTEDLWTWHARNPDVPYNSLYDLMHLAGLSIHQMRICQPYGDDQRRGLWLFHLIEPDTWARVVARVNGANSGSLYAQEHGNINGYRRVSKPEGLTWQGFAELLIQSMPPATKVHYENKMLLFQRWWMERGYPDGIPDEAPYDIEAARKAPSWRRICKALLRNDYWFKGMGFSQHKSTAYGRYLDLMRRRRGEWRMDPLGRPDEQLTFMEHL